LFRKKYKIIYEEFPCGSSYEEITDRTSLRRHWTDASFAAILRDDSVT